MLFYIIIVCYVDECMLYFNIIYNIYRCNNIKLSSEFNYKKYYSFFQNFFSYEWILNNNCI